VCGTKRAVCAAIDSILHFGTHSREGAWKNILHANITGLPNVYEAARLCGVRRVVWVSSNHAVLFDRRGNIVHTVYPMRGKLLRHLQGLWSKLYAEKYALKVFNLCIANVAVEPIDKHRLTTRISPDQEILKCDRQPKRIMGQCKCGDGKQITGRDRIT
jgi:uronate dehydrogenase